MLMLNAPAEENCTVKVMTIDGTAIDGPDYTGGVYNVTFPEGSSKAELHIPIRDDDKPESDETFTATLMIPDSAEGVEAGENNIATVTITDDDKKLVNFNPIEYSVSEDDTYVILMLMLNTPAEENCTVKVMTIDGTAIDEPDYTGGVYNVTFPEGSSKAELHIPIRDDDKPESDETFTATLMIPDSAEGVEAGENNIATVTITDDDKKLVNFNPIEYSVSEDDTYVILMLMLNDSS
jgi:tRNA threonylcarbamoyladenosine modification (KEOPS) complex Cgi121 subunit